MATTVPTRKGNEHSEEERTVSKIKTEKDKIIFEQSQPDEKFEAPPMKITNFQEAVIGTIFQDCSPADVTGIQLSLGLATYG